MALQERFNAGYNRRVRQPPFITDGGNNSPLEIDLGDARDGFRLIDIVPAAVNSDSGLMKVTYEHQGYANILVHITRMKR
jgi:hypothetical protein